MALNDYLILVIIVQFFTGYEAAFTLSCAANADCDVNQPRGSSSCDFQSDTLFERQTCSIGACKCNTGFALTPDGCKPAVSLNVGERCSKAAEERYPYSAYCRSTADPAVSNVACFDNMYFASNSTPPGCKYILPVKTFGERCNATLNWCDTTVGLECSTVSATCVCGERNAIWRDGRCTLERFYGDTCQTDNDCTPPSGTFSVGMFCDAGRCTCQSGYVARVLAMKMPTIPPAIDTPPFQIKYRLMCLDDSKSAPSEPGQPCHVTPDSASVNANTSPMSPIRYCWHNALCFRCPGDPSTLANSETGRCYQLADPPAIPRQMLDVFWQYFSSSTTTAPATRPTEPSTKPSPTAHTPLPPSGKGDRSGKFGDYCWNDMDCHETAFCLIDLVNTIHPPCSAAICVCRHGNEPDTNGTCKSIRHLLVGDACTNPIFEILPPGTACENGKVVCDSPKFVQDPKYDTQCVLAITILTYGQICNADDTQSECDSAAGLECLPSSSADPWREGPDTSTRCWCSIGMWDGSACQVSDYGEVCRVNTDCRGYPLAGVTCNRGSCLCQTGFRPFRTLQLILMQRESLGLGGAMSNALGAATLYRQTVCVNENTTLVASLSGSCSALIDPRAGAQLCRDGLFCFRCPVAGDSTSRQTAAVLSSGSCRTLNMLAATGLDLFGGTNEDPYVMRGSDIIESNTVGHACSYDSDCSLNQQCSKSSRSASAPVFHNSTYECQNGYCVCQPGFGLDANQLCRPLVTVKLGQWCSLSTTNVMYPANSGCYFGKVECNYPYKNRDDSCQLNPVTTIREFGQSCMNAGRDICRMPLVCLSVEGSDNMTCKCPDENDIYDFSLATCRRRQFADPCNTDSQCDTGAFAALGQATCNRLTKLCDCRAGRSYAADVTRWNATSRTQFTATICLDNIVSRNTRSGPMGMCTLRLIQQRGTTPMSIIDQGGLCRPGLLCHQCPDDRDDVSSNYGFCRPLK